MLVLVAMLSWAQVTPLRTPAAVDDSYALRFNPAGLGVAEGSELRLLYTRDGLDPGPGEPGSSNGFGLYSSTQVFPGFALGGSVDVQVDGNEQTQFGTALGAGWSAGPLAFGLSWIHEDAQGQDAKNRIDTGLTLRGRYLGAARAIQDAAQTAGRRRWDMGVAIHPWERLTLSARWRLEQDLGLNADNLDLLGLVSAEPLDGVVDCVSHLLFVSNIAIVIGLWNAPNSLKACEPL